MRIRIQVFMRKNSTFFRSKIAIYFSVGLQILQPSKENIQHFKTLNISVDILCPPGSGSDPDSDPDPDP
jgi:hypothetical protein